jgi:pimeloyl-ACP methyl ester carboxylesterase
VIYQRSLIESSEQREAAQYVTQFRTPGFEQFVQQQGFGWFFDATLAPHIDRAKLAPGERERYIEEWSQPGAFLAMLNWYRAAKFVVPAPGAAASVPEWAVKPCPKIEVPTLVIWGMKDFALMPVQLEGLDEVVADIRIVRLPNAGHFATWEAPDAVASALEAFLVRTDQPLVAQ